MPKTDIKVKLVGADGNACYIIGKVSELLRKNGYKDLVSSFIQEATSEDFNHMLQTVNEYVIIE